MRVKILINCEIGGAPRYAGGVFPCCVLIGRALIKAGIAAPYDDNQKPTENAMLTTDDMERR